MGRKKYYRTKEVMQLLNCTDRDVYTLLRSGELIGHKQKGHYLIDIDQPFFNFDSEDNDEDFESDSIEEDYEEEEEINDESIDQECDNSVPLIYVRDYEHNKIIYDMLMHVEQSLCVATANVKNLYFPGGMHFLEILNELAEKGIYIRLIYSDARDSIIDQIEDYHNLAEGNNFEYMHCVRNHMKVFVFDKKRVYIGSGNLTSSAIGRKSLRKRNFEAGIITSIDDIVEKAVEHFDDVWNESFCKNCKSKICAYNEN